MFNNVGCVPRTINYWWVKTNKVLNITEENPNTSVSNTVERWAMDKKKKFKDEARGWSIDKLRFELETLEREYDRLYREYRAIEEDYHNETPETNPSAFHPFHGYRLAEAAPIGLTTIPREMEHIKEQIKILREVLRGKL